MRHRRTGLGLAIASWTLRAWGLSGPGSSSQTR
jgi:hypothetical protein